MNLALGIHFGPRIALVAATLQQPTERHQHVVAPLLRMNPHDPLGAPDLRAIGEAIIKSVQSICEKLSGRPQSITLVLNDCVNPNGGTGDLDHFLPELRSALSHHISSALNDVEIRPQPVVHGALQNLVFLPTGAVNTAIDFDIQTWAIAVVGATSSDYLVANKGALTTRRSGGGHVSGEEIATEIHSSIASSETLNGAFVVADPSLETAIRHVLPRVILPQAPEWAVAEGFCRYALFCAARHST
ncbi:hypothetical protein [Burkholderia anthina]|uniref:hypothetical protein n=1 Tax=Burkholderia anthina TaxID=179879 RepID=UPI00158B58B1|nr:hypothetical protein [Burkholderia anthina]